MYVYLATISGWDGKSIVGVFKTEDGALRASITYLLSESIDVNPEEVQTPINQKIEEWGTTWDITNSNDALVIIREEVK